MQVLLTDDQKAFVRQAIESGRYRREEEALADALSLWEDRERTRVEILSAVEAAERSLGDGRGRILTEETMRDLATDVKSRGRARLAADSSQ